MVTKTGREEDPVNKCPDTGYGRLIVVDRGEVLESQFFR